MSIETFKKQLLERKLKDLTPEAFDVLFNYAFGNVLQTEAVKVLDDKPYTAPQFTEKAEQPLTKNARALQTLARYPKGLTASELAKVLKEEVRLVYPLLSNLKRSGQVHWKDGVYSIKNWRAK